jgi:hypothetical protein
MDEQEKKNQPEMKDILIVKVPTEKIEKNKIPHVSAYQRKEEYMPPKMEWYDLKGLERPNASPDSSQPLTYDKTHNSNIISYCVSNKTDHL